MVEWPSSWGTGVLCLYFQAQSPLLAKPGLNLLSGGEASLQRPELPPPQKKMEKSIKNGVSLMERMFYCKKRMFFFEK